MKTLCFDEISKLTYGVAVIETVLNANEITEVHNHLDFSELFIVNKGQVHHTLNGESMVLSRGDFRLIRSSDAHPFQKDFEQPAGWVNIAFPNLFLEEVLQDTGLDSQDGKLVAAGRLTSVQMIVIENLLSLLTRVELFPEETGEQKTALLKSLLRTILLTSSLQRSREPDDIPSWLSQTINALYEKDVLQEGVQGMVRVCGYSQEHMTRQIKKYYHQTPSQIVNKVRIDTAQKMLANTELSILEISDYVGYESVSYFNRLFAKQVGMAPRVYRKSVRNSV